jgi:hypothetical protein
MTSTKRWHLAGRLPRRLWSRLMAMGGRRFARAASLVHANPGSNGASLLVAAPWRQRWPRLIELALIGLLVLVGLFVLMAAIQAKREWTSARELHQTYAQLTGVQPSMLAAQTAQREEMVKRISTHRLIAPPPSFQLTGVLGDGAIFNGGMIVKVGQSAGDMKIQSIGANWVEVVNNGQTQKLYVFQPQMPESPASSAMPGPRSAPGEKLSSPASQESKAGVPRTASPVAAPRAVAQP